MSGLGCGGECPISSLFGPFDDKYESAGPAAPAEADPEPSGPAPGGGSDPGRWDPETDPANPLKTDERELQPA